MLNKSIKANPYEIDKIFLIAGNKKLEIIEIDLPDVRTWFLIGLIVMNAS
jgi:hypothetical protein